MRLLPSLLLSLLPLLLLSPPANAQYIHPPYNLTLLESPRNANLTLSEPLMTSHNLPQFLTTIVSKSGLIATTPTDEDTQILAYTRGFRWADEKNSTEWTPVAVATWEDSVSDVTSEKEMEGVEDGVRGAMMVSWRHEGAEGKGDMGVRVSFIVNGTVKGGRKRYLHVLLVEDVSKTTSADVQITVLQNMNSRGGLVWHGDYLYLGDSTKGLRVFNMNNIWQVPDPKKTFGYKYILPQERTYTPQNFPQSYKYFTFAFLAMDRNSTPPSLLVGEYEPSDSGATYLAKWPFDGITGRLKTSSTKTKTTAEANWGYRITVPRVRGMVLAGTKYFIVQLPGLEGQPEVEDVTQKAGAYIWLPGTMVERVEGVFPRGGAGIAYLNSTGEVWAVGTAEGSRAVLAIDAGEYLKPGGDGGGTSTGGAGDTQASSTATRPPGTSQTGGGAANTPDPSATSSNTNTTTTTNTNTTAPPSAPPTGAIVGGVIGALIGLILLILLVLYLRRRRTPPTDPNPPYPPPGFRSASVGDDYGAYQGEIPMVKPELDANGTQVHDYAAAVAAAGETAEEKRDLQRWEELKRAVRMPARKPVPGRLPEGYGGSERPRTVFVELPGGEGRPVEAP